jgi:hypothetical protein
VPSDALVQLQQKDDDKGAATHNAPSTSHTAVAAAHASGQEASNYARLDEQLQVCCSPFLQWLPMAPVHASESVKRRRIFKEDQLTPIKNNLRFVFQQLIDADALPQGKVELEALTLLQVCQQLAAALDRRQVGSARLYAIFLLVKKILVYLASQETKQRLQLITPDTFSSYPFVDALCSRSSEARRMEASNRRVFGAQVAKALQQGHQGGLTGGLHLSPTAFQMPSFQGKFLGAAGQGAQQPNSVAAAAAASNADSPSPWPDTPVVPPSANEMTKEELQTVTAGSLAYLQQHPPGSFFVHHLVTATLCLGMAPRSQVLRQLQIGTSFVKKSDGRYWVQMPAELN